MGSERIKVEKHLKDCGNSWCRNPAGCSGHTIGYTYNSVVDISTVTIDGEAVIVMGDDLVVELAHMILDSQDGAPNESE